MQFAVLVSQCDSQTGGKYSMKRLVTSIAIGAMMLGSIATLGVTAASSAGPSMTVTPSTNLTGGQAVTVTASGFGANETLAIIECLATATTSADCDTTNYVLVSSDGSGSVAATTFHVLAETISTGSCGTSATDTNCTLAVGNPSNPAEKASFPITFAAPGTTTTTTTTTPGSTTTTTTTTTVPATTTTTSPIVLGPRHIKVAPSTKLRNGQTVVVTGSGFKPGDHVFVLECLASVHSAAQCNLKTMKAAKITAKGILPGDARQGIDGQDRHRDLWHEGIQQEVVRHFGRQCRQG